MKKILWLLIVGLMLGGCSSDSTEEVNTGGIAGSVSDQTTGEPVATVNVTLSPGGKSTVTGSDGSFSFVDLKHGAYTIDIRKEGYNPNSKTVEVVAGQQSSAHLLIERIPAIVTADRKELDFGSDYGVTSLSFNIVNNYYTDLEWEVVASCGWIKNILPLKGMLTHGQTGTIIVQIDRDNLQDGNNKTVLVLTTTGVGSTEVTVKAVGVAKKVAVLNTLEPTSVAASFATVNGEIVDPGYPTYTERGFVYSESQMPTVEQTIQRLTVPVTNDREFSSKVGGLTLGKTYYVRAYAVNPIGIAYSSNQVSFTTVIVVPTVSIAKVDNLDKMAHTAIAHGSVVFAGEPSYTERGFVYSDISSTPTIYNKSVTVEGLGMGSYDGLLSNLAEETTYYVRAYAKNEAGIAYSDVKSFSTNPVAPSVSIIKVDNIDKTAHTAIAHGSIVSAGSPSYTERGFVYSNISSTPTIYNKSVTVEGLGMGSYDGLLSNLAEETTYYVRAYAKNDADITYSDVITFSTKEVLPQVKTLEPINTNNTSRSATLRGQIVSIGDPAYTERGFVYSTEFKTPTINDTKLVVEGSGSGTFETQGKNFSSENITYVRAYATNHKGTAYGETVELFSPEFVELSAAGIAVQRRDIGRGDWSSVNAMCENSVVADKTDWRLPTKDELMVLYNERNYIGGFSTTSTSNASCCYWSSTLRSGSYYYIRFDNGAMDYNYSFSFYSGRCVRTLK